MYLFYIVLFFMLLSLKIVLKCCSFCDKYVSYAT